MRAPVEEKVFCLPRSGLVAEAGLRCVYTCLVLLHGLCKPLGVKGGRYLQPRARGFGIFHSVLLVSHVHGCVCIYDCVSLHSSFKGLHSGVFTFLLMGAYSSEKKTNFISLPGFFSYRLSLVLVNSNGFIENH